MATGPLKCELKGNEIVVDNNFRISFRRTIRVPDNEQHSKLPSDLGAYPFKAVADYSKNMKPVLTAKGGAFFSMYRKFILIRKIQYMH